VLVAGYWFLQAQGTKYQATSNQQQATSNKQQVTRKDMALNNAKHIIGEIDGIRCTIIESGATLERIAFLSDLLSFNNLVTKDMKESVETPGEEQKYTLGVTDLVFNPVFAVYERQLKNREGTFVTPGYWKEECTDCDPRYWMRRKNIRPAS
jgi:hypothetical protein